MGFVDDEQTDGLSRREDRRPGTDADMTRPVLHAQPVVALLPLGQLAVHDDDIVAETAQEAADNLAGQGDLPALRRRPVSLFSGPGWLELHVDFCLAAAGDTVEDVCFTMLIASDNL